MQEDQSEVDRRVRATRIAAGVTALIAAISVLVMYICLSVMAPDIFWLMFLFFAIVFGGIFGVMAVMLYRVGSKMTPTKIYENGIETFSSMGTKRIFVSYGELSAVREAHSRLMGDYYLFSSAGSVDTIIVSKSLRGFPEMLESIRSRMDKEEYVVKLPRTHEEVRSSRRLEYGLYAMALIIGAGVSAFTAYGLHEGDATELLFTFGLYFPLISIPSFALIIITTRSLRRYLPQRLNIKVPAALVVGLVIYFFVSAGAFGAITGATPAVEKHIEPKPASSFLAPGTYANTTVSVEGYILVDAGQTLTFRNCTVNMNLTADKEFGIWVAEGGSLVMENTTLQSSVSAYTYPFEIMGSARILGSTIYGLWADPAWSDYDGGLEIYSSDVLIDRLRLYNARLSTILVVDASPVISNSTITGAGDDGIELENASPHVTNNTIAGCEFAMYINRGSAPLIDFNVFSRNQYGLLIEYSDPVIKNNIFRYTEHYAAKYRKNSAPTFSGNTYISNGDNILTEYSSASVTLCGFAIIVEAVATLLVLFWFRREDARRARGDLGGPGQTGMGRWR